MFVLTLKDILTEVRRVVKSFASHRDGIIGKRLYAKHREERKMRVKSTNPDAVFQSIRGAAEITGLSTKYIRAGCRSGNIPHVLVGSDYRINMPLFLRQLDEASRGNCNAS